MRAAPNSTVMTALLLILTLVAVLAKQNRSDKPKQPPRLDETIPFVSNLWQFMTNKRLFITRARAALEIHPVIRCRLGPLDLHLLRGGNGNNNNISNGSNNSNSNGSNHGPPLFRATCHSDPWTLRIMRSAGYTPRDLAKLARDDSGAAATPRPGVAGGAGGAGGPDRIWHALHRLYDSALASARATDAFADRFQAALHAELVAPCPGPGPGHGGEAGEWTEGVRIFDTLKRTMTAAATHAALGPLMAEVNPGFVDAFWAYECHVEGLAFGLPDWLNREAVRARARFSDMCRRWYEVAEPRFEWDASGDGAEEWEPVFGSRLSSGLARWARRFGFEADSMGPVFMLLHFGLHANTIPVCTWVVMELLKDPELFQAVREEISQAELVRDGPDATFKGFDHRKLGSLPLLQSVYTEVLRLHVGVLITRTCTAPLTVGGYTLPKGSILQAPTEVGHLSEAVWSTQEHPASEFWAHRHVKETETRDEMTGQVSKRLKFSLAGRSGSFFPFGGGTGMCPGRNFAKPEVLLAVAMIVSSFEVDDVTWLKPDGSLSDRAAQNDVNYANSVAAAPDREMRVRWRRVR
ncbi:cytochrome P450 [Chaetomium fimeti]|uniref:Cytochrome P450 n=1 Tax=Chaetomium fimeti TaxID=1854472 RepID=A0AAE0LNV8_9PEZI|nr:cytochrome P450 [Chaetomium fimeti]